jgi:hypothetical protein
MKVAGQVAMYKFRGSQWSSFGDEMYGLAGRRSLQAKTFLMKHSLEVVCCKRQAFVSLMELFHTDITGYLELALFSYSWDSALFLRVGLLAWIEEDGGPPTLWAYT